MHYPATHAARHASPSAPTAAFAYGRCCLWLMPPALVAHVAQLHACALCLHAAAYEGHRREVKETAAVSCGRCNGMAQQQCALCLALVTHHFEQALWLTQVQLYTYAWKNPNSPADHCSNFQPLSTWAAVLTTICRTAALCMRAQTQLPTCADHSNVPADCTANPLC
jgi:hypothetical protein